MFWNEIWGEDRLKSEFPVEVVSYNALRCALYFFQRLGVKIWIQQQLFAEKEIFLLFLLTTEYCSLVCCILIHILSPRIRFTGVRFYHIVAAIISIVCVFVKLDTVYANETAASTFSAVIWNFCVIFTDCDISFFPNIQEVSTSLHLQLLIIMMPRRSKHYHYSPQREPIRLNSYVLLHVNNNV